MTSIIVLTLLGSFLWRLRGGLLNGITGQQNYRILGIPFNDTVVRLIWSFGMSIALFLFSTPEDNLIKYSHSYQHYFHISFGLAECLTVLFLAITFFYGVTVIGWRGADLLPTKIRDVVKLSIDGVFRLILTAIALWNIWPLIAGILMGPCYWIAAKLPVPKKMEKWLFWGEFITGACIGFCLSMTLKHHI